MPAGDQAQVAPRVHEPQRSKGASSTSPFENVAIG
jgi:hypothetical protein